MKNGSYDCLELKIPEWLVHLKNLIFENLPADRAENWIELFSSSINVGVNLENVKHKIAIRRLDNLIMNKNKLLNNNDHLKEVIVKDIALIEVIKKCHEMALNKTYYDWTPPMSVATSVMKSMPTSASVVEWTTAWGIEADILIDELKKAG